MRWTRAIFATVVGGGAMVGWTVFYWRRNPRLGTTFMNAVVDPFMQRRGLVGGTRSEIGSLEHVGRRSGVRRLTPVHPEPTATGFRIVVPLGERSEWAHNVIAAGHCRLQLHDIIYDLDEPVMIPASEVGGLPASVRTVLSTLGFEYLELHAFGARPGAIEGVVMPSLEPDPADPEAAPVC